MSIAASAQLRPSRRLLCLSLLMAAALLAASTLLILRGHADRLAMLMAVICAIAGIALILFPISTTKAYRIDVTGIGEILLTHTPDEAVADRTNESVVTAEVVQLLGDSTLWSSLMVLRLQSASGKTYRLLLMPDSMDREAYRALSIACRWIASRSSRNDG